MQIDLFPQEDEILWVAGVDEAGRGPLCGDVYAAAVILDDAHGIIGLTDSKKISEKNATSLLKRLNKKRKHGVLLQHL